MSQSVSVPLGEVVTLHYGKALSRSERSDQGSVPVYGANGVKDFTSAPLTTGPTWIIGRKGSAGEINRVDGPFWPLDVTYYTSHDEARIEFNYLGYMLQTYNLPALARGVKPGINRNDVYALGVPLPPLDVQKRMVAILDQAFAALDRARAHAEANLEDARALFDSVLVTTFDDLLPQSEMMTLARAAKDFSRGKSRHRPRNAPELYGGRYPFIQTGDIRRSEGSIREFSQTYSEVGLAQSKLWPVGTVCITIAANIAETGVMEFEGCFPDSVIGMVPDPEVADPYYVEYMLRYFAEELKQKGKGAAQDNINLATFESALFPFPSREKQRVVVEKLDGIAAYTKQARRGYEQAVAGIAALRQSLLQQAFSGRL